MRYSVIVGFYTGSQRTVLETDDEQQALREARQWSSDARFVRVYDAVIDGDIYGADRSAATLH